MPDLTGNTALVLGGTRGIGRAVGAALAAAGAHTVVTGRDSAAADQAAAAIRAEGGKAEGVAVNIRDVEGTRQTISAVAEDHGGLHARRQRGDQPLFRAA